MRVSLLAIVDNVIPIALVQLVRVGREMGGFQVLALPLFSDTRKLSSPSGSVNNTAAFL